eukprot:PhM_4_TR7823/c0_g1_i1/m.73716
MVVIVLKKPPKDEWSKDYDEFNVTCGVNDNIGEVTDKVKEIFNTRIRLKWILDAAKGLQETVKKQQPDNADAARVFDAPIADAATAMKYGSTATVEECLQCIDSIQGAVKIVFPMHVSGTKAEYLRKMAAALEDESTSEADRILLHRILSVVDDGATTPDLFTPDTMCCLWWSGKCLARDGVFSSYVGKNDKTKITCKITPMGSQPPVREPALDHTTQKEMMAYYYKKQEEHKKLIEDDDITYGSSDWADPNALKRQFNGTSNIRLR